MFFRRKLWVTAAVLAAAGWLVWAGTAVADEPSLPSFGSPGTLAPGASAKDDDTKKEDDVEAKKRAAMVKNFTRKLGRMKPDGTLRKSMDDFFLVGTADLDPATGHADVRFSAKQGQEAVAEFLVSYITEAPQSIVRKWHVFYRLKDAEQAEEALQYVRTQYDQAEAYRETIKRAYGARTVRRS